MSEKTILTIIKIWNYGALQVPIVNIKLCLNSIQRLYYIHNMIYEHNKLQLAVDKLQFVIHVSFGAVIIMT